MIRALGWSLPHFVWQAAAAAALLAAHRRHPESAAWSIAFV
jgi:hypothetical protein